MASRFLSPAIMGFLVPFLAIMLAAFCILCFSLTKLFGRLTRYIRASEEIVKSAPRCAESATQAVNDLWKALSPAFRFSSDFDRLTVIA